MKNVWHTNYNSGVTAGSSSTVSSIQFTIQKTVIIKKILTSAILVDNTNSYKQYNRFRVRIYNGLQNNMPNRPPNMVVMYWINENILEYFESNLIFNTGTTFQIDCTVYGSLLATDTIQIGHSIYWDYIDN